MHVRVAGGHQLPRSGGAQLTQGPDDALLALEPVREVPAQLVGSRRHHRTVRRVDHAGPQLEEAPERGEVIQHVPLGRVDDHRAHASHQVARHDRAAPFLQEADVAARVPGKVQALPSPRPHRQRIPVAQHAVDAEVEQLRRLRRRGDRQRQLARKLRRAPDVIVVVVREQDAHGAPALLVEQRERLFQDGLLLGVRRSGIDDPQLLVAEQQAVRVRRRW